MTINGIHFNELPVALVNRETLARTTTSIKMGGQIKRGYFPLLRNGELIPVTVMLNKMTNFAKLQVGK